MFEHTARTKRGLQPAALATSRSTDSLEIMSLIRSCCDFAKFGAIMGSYSPSSVAFSRSYSRQQTDKEHGTKSQRRASKDLMQKTSLELQRRRRIIPRLQYKTKEQLTKTTLVLTQVSYQSLIVYKEEDEI